MYVDGYMLFAIYIIAVIALIISIYALWSLEEVRRYYIKTKNTVKNTSTWNSKPPAKTNKAIGHWD